MGQWYNASSKLASVDHSGTKNTGKEKQLIHASYIILIRNIKELYPVFYEITTASYIVLHTY